MQAFECLVHRVHAEVRSVPDTGIQVGRFAIVEQFFYGGRGSHDFDGGNAPTSTGPMHEPLRRDAEQGRAQLLTDLPLEMFRETVDDTVNGGGGGSRVQCGNDQMPYFGGSHSHVHCLAVAQFADGNHVGALPGDAVQGRLKGMGVGADFALMNHAFVVAENILDWLLDGENVGMFVPVDFFDKGREGCGLAASGRAGEDNQALRFECYFFQDGGQAEFFNRVGPQGNDTKHRADFAAFQKQIGPDTRKAGNGEDHIEFVFLLQFFHPLFGVVFAKHFFVGAVEQTIPVSR